MIKKTKLIPLFIGIIGIIRAISYIGISSKPKPIAMPVTQLANVPYKRYIGGAGLTEPNSENISIGTHIPGIVREIHVTVGDTVKKDDPLFIIEDRETSARVAQAEAIVKQREAELKNTQDQLRIITNVKDERAISKDERNQRARSVEVARAVMDAARAEARALRTKFALHTVRAPVDGVVMAMNLRVGEYAAAATTGDALIQLGNLYPLHLRVDIDENDAWRFEKGANAKAFLRGNPNISVPLEFVRLEPFVRPKRSLTGGSSERVDTRVLQIIYRFDPTGKPIYAGQQMDIYIESKPEAQMVKPSTKESSGE